ncbi:MAG: hypothetical protein A3G38_02240 [Omnitrophica WOR_2 bacterium RIFCSPLOWO2_12_FULL_51_8]|nr:MAG: hypothetical protein A3G38_02240 [Omnitrophica WOR_2 bacterium RIFCSPLOWO2_12_FULL_51_8]
MEQLSTENERPRLTKSSKTFVVVEDDPTMCRLWGRLLSQINGLNFVVFSSAREAIKYLDSEPADVLLTDLVLEEMSGVDVVLKALAKNHDTKIILTSAFPETRYDLSPIGCFIHFIKKPYRNLDILRELILLFMDNADEISDAEVSEDDRQLYVWDL